jgi:hypothetical protein
MPTASIRLLRKRDLILVGPTFLSAEVVHDKAGRGTGGSADLGPGSGRCRNSAATSAHQEVGDCLS